MDKKLAQTFMVAGVVVKKDGKFLLIQENRPHNPKVHETWNLPAGKVDEGDSLESAAIREAKEESGFDVEIIRKVGTYQENVSVPVKHAFEAKIIGGEINFPKDEILDARWFTLEEVRAMKDKLRDEWVLQAIESII
jgi:NADH pyrophosphatase NudC (nudix superfamily)